MALDTFNPYLFVSSGEQSNKFLTPTYADGIAKFQAQRAQELTGLTVRIDLIQEGAGDPAPDNIRPISGRTGLTVTRAGKNLMCVDNWEVDEDCPITIANGKMTVVRSAYQENKNRYILPSTDQMTLSFHVKTIAIENSLATFKLYADGTPIVPTQGASISGNIYLVSVGNEADVIATFTGKHYISFGSWAYGGTVEISNIQLEFGSSATSYEPYQGQSIQIPLGQTFYGGTLDVVSGVLTVTHAYWTKNTATMNNTELFPGWIASGIKAIIGEGKNDIFKGMTGNVGTVIGINTGDMNDIVFMPKQFYAQMTQTDWIAMELDVQFVLPLATPQTYQLTPTEVRMLAGFNQVYSDAGPVIDIKF